MKRKKKSRRRGYIEIPVRVYRVCVIVAWGMSRRSLIALGKRHKVRITAKKWGADFDQVADDPRAVGLCMEFGDDNTDILVWLRKRPRRCSEFGTLYHELHHAVAAIVASRNLYGEKESPAFLYEYLATEANRELWKRA